MDRMASRKRIREKSLRAVILALVTVLAVLIVPVCAPLCAARACEKAMPMASAHEKCHGMSMAKDQRARLNGYSLKACSGGELPAAIVSSKKSEPSVGERRGSAVDSGSVADVAAVSSLMQAFRRADLRSRSLEKREESGVTVGVLRI
jgi:hypothetical protein